MAKPIVKLSNTENRQLRRGRHPRSQEREPLKISARQQAAELLEYNRLTDRDINLARAFIAVGILSRDQIQRLFFHNHLKLAGNRLVRLYQYHYLDRGLHWMQEMAEMGIPPSYVYTLNRVGMEAYALYINTPIGEVPYTPDRYRLTRHNHFLLHDLQISEMYTRLQVGARASRYEMTWFNETAAILRDREEELVRPDGLAVLETKDKDWEAGYFVEMDRGNTPWAKKVAHYERARRQSAWQVIFQLRQYPPVLCVVPRRLQRAVEETIREKQPVTRFYLKNWDDFLADEVFEGWRLAGSEGVYRLGQGGMNSG
jgi:hypothetical protein